MTPQKYPQIFIPTKIFIFLKTQNFEQKMAQPTFEWKYQSTTPTRRACNIFQRLNLFLRKGQRFASSRLSGGKVFCPWVRHFNLGLVLVQLRMTGKHPDFTAGGIRAFSSPFLVVNLGPSKVWTFIPPLQTLARNSSWCASYTLMLVV